LPGAGTFRAYAPCPRRRVHPSRDGRVPDRLGRGAPPRRLRLHIDAIAARAGTCRTTVKNALREARRLNLVTVQERRRRGQRSLTNIIHIISREWRDWLQHERQKRRQAEFVTDEEQRLLEIEDMRLVVKFGEKRRYSDRECQAIYQELIEAGLNNDAMRDPDAIAAVFRKLNAADEAEAARRYLCG
jgi:hypothetical protein